MDAETVLKPCPFCDGMDTDMIEQDDKEYFMVGCLRCWTQGPSKITEAEAIAAWNARPTVEAPAGVVERIARELGAYATAEIGDAYLGEMTDEDWEGLARAALSALLQRQAETGGPFESHVRDLVDELRKLGPLSTEVAHRVYTLRALLEGEPKPERPTATDIELATARAADALTTLAAENAALRERVRGLTPAAQIIVGLFDAQTPEQKKARPAAIDKAVREFRALLEPETGKPADVEGGES